MAADHSGRKNSNTQLLQELEALSESLYQSHVSSTRRIASLALARSAVPPISSADEIGTEKVEERLNPKPRPRRMSLSPWRSRPKFDEEDKQRERSTVSTRKETKKLVDESATSEKHGIWKWKPIRALSHIGMQKLSCLFSVEVVTVQDLPASMNGLRLSVCVRKKESKDGAVQTMPSRVSQGAADFEETLFIRCHVYFTPGSGTHMKFEPRPFLIYVFAVDAEELDFGKSSVDLSHLIEDSIEKSLEGTRIRQWDTTFNLSGKAKGGELVLKLGFQIMEKDGGIGIYGQAGGQKSVKNRNNSPSVARRHSKSSFSVPSPRMTSQAEAWTPSQKDARSDLQGIDDQNLGEPAPTTSTSKPLQSEEQESKLEDLDLPDFEVVDKGVEIQDKDEDDGQSEENSDKRSVSSEVVKEIVHDQFHLTRLTELDSIAQQIKALESMMREERVDKTEEETASQLLDADEETVTKEFLQMLEGTEANKTKINPEILSPKPESNENTEEMESNILLPDLGKGLGCVIQTRNGGFLAAMNPLDTEMAKKDTPKLAMQISKPLVLQSIKNGFELLQKIGAMGLEELSSEILSLMPVDELIGKTAEQIAFEGIASAIIHGRTKEGANSSAARTIAAVKSMVTAMRSGRKERISTGIWNVSEAPLTIDEILAFSMQKIEVMAIDALKIQADMTEEDSPFDVSPIDAKTIGANGKVYNHPLASAVPVEEWTKVTSTKSPHDDASDPPSITVSVVVQLRDPMRQYEAVGGPIIVLIHAMQFYDKTNSPNEETRYKVTSLLVGGLKVRTPGRKNVWDTEKQRLTALQWLVAYGMGKAGKKGKRLESKGLDLLWSISSRVMADMWLKPIRNPDVKLAK